MTEPHHGATMRMLFMSALGGLLAANLTHAQTVNTINSQNYFDDLCNRTFSSSGRGSILSLGGAIQAATREGQNDLYNVCSDYFQSDGSLPSSFFEALSAESFEVFKLDALLFAQTENDSVMDRLQALRRSKRSSNQTAFDFDLNGHSLAGGGASADDADGLLSAHWGFWVRASDGKGYKDPTALTGVLDTDQRSIAAGTDYRLGSNTVFGVAASARNSHAMFGPRGVQGAMDSKSWTFSAYASSFVYRDLYIDAVVNYGKSNYDTLRHIVDSSGLVPDHRALGNTHGQTMSVGTSAGYDWASGPLTLTPAVGYLYIDSKMDAFEETGAEGLDLRLGKQHFHSTTAHLDMNLAYAVNTSVGVWQPYVRAQWVREFSDGIDTLDVRFVNDVDSTAAPLAVQLDQLDRQYWRMNAGVSVQLPQDVSAYFDYQRLVGFEAVSFQNLTLGLRMQF